MTRTNGIVGCFGVLALFGCSTVPTEPADGTHGSLTAVTVSELSRDADPEGLSDITRIGGNRYWCVNDRGGLLHEMEIVLDEDGLIDSCRAVREVKLEGRVDLEGCAVDPIDGRVWVSDEHDHSVRQFDPATGKETARVPIPAEYARHMVANRSFEALAISPDGRRMYVANEDTLTCDGPVANGERGGVVRLQEFARSGKGASWRATRQFRYPTEKIEGSPFSGRQISGVAACCVTDSGSVLVLEREFSCKGSLLPSCLARLYEVRPNEGKSDLVKRLVWEEDTAFSNYEGICFGPTLKDGRQTLVLVSDGGGEAEETLLVLALTVSSDK